MNFKLTIPPSTLERAAVIQSYDIGRHVINKMIVHIPDGHKYLAHLQVMTKGKLIVPEFGSGEKWIEGNNNDLEINPPAPIVLDGPPYEITLRGYNDDDTYQHMFLLEVK